jgi:hypothetical protein
MRVSGVAFVACLLFAGTAVAREHTSDARHHLKRANELAGQGKCAAAVKEFTAAYEKLRDPVLLFNRAECYRNLGENAKAADDYRGFLKGFPAAPNRAEIEARIATLERPAARPAAPPPRTPPSPAQARAPARTTTPPPTTRAPADVTAPPPPSSPAAEAVGPMPFLPPPPEEGAVQGLIEAPRSAPKDNPRAAHGSRWWLWTALAVVAVGGGVGGYFALRPKTQTLPPSTFGNYQF